MKMDKIACNCSNVTYGKIYKAVEAGARTFEDVSEVTSCSKSCGKCEEFIRILVRDFVEEIEGCIVEKTFVK